MQANTLELLDKKICLLLWAKDEQGKDDVARYTGTLKENGKGMYIDRGPDNPKFEIQEDWVARIKVVEDDFKESLLGSDVALSLKVGDAPEGMLGMKTGLKWPQ